MTPFRLLVLGGTGDARELAAQVKARFGDQISCVYSIAGRTDAPALPPVEIRRGGFGGVSGLTKYLCTTECDAVVDATHPFAERISQNALIACSDTATPLVALTRPAWQPTPADDWRTVGSLAAAAAMVARRGWRRVFVTTGRTGLEAFEALRETFLLVRLFGNPHAPLALHRHELIVDRGPFNVAAEGALQRRYRIDALVAKASGGDATQPKLLAARGLGLPVVLVRRPSGTQLSVGSHAAVLEWVGRRLRERCNAESRKGRVDPCTLAGH